MLGYLYYAVQISAQKDEMLIRRQRNNRILGELEETDRDAKSLSSEILEMQHLIERMGRQLAAFKAKATEENEKEKFTAHEHDKNMMAKLDNKQAIQNAIEVPPCAKEEDRKVFPKPDTYLNIPFCPPSLSCAP